MICIYVIFFFLIELKKSLRDEKGVFGFSDKGGGDDIGEESVVLKGKLI